jgi:hypothetical protein
MNQDNYVDLVYNVRRLQNGYSPSVVMIPTNEVMFKLMRACVGVYSVQDLWFNQGIEQEEEEEREAAILEAAMESESNFNDNN